MATHTYMVSYRTKRLKLDLSLVRCSCPAGTEGTQACNYGRSCGVLKVTGKDVAELLIMEGLAKPFHCSRDGSPKREPGARRLPAQCNRS